MLVRGGDAGALSDQSQWLNATSGVPAPPILVWRP